MWTCGGPRNGSNARAAFEEAYEDADDWNHAERERAEDRFETYGWGSCNKHVELYGNEVDRWDYDDHCSTYVDLTSKTRPLPKREDYVYEPDVSWLPEASLNHTEWHQRLWQEELYRRKRRMPTSDRRPDTPSAPKCAPSARSCAGDWYGTTSGAASSCSTGGRRPGRRCCAASSAWNSDARRGRPSAPDGAGSWCGAAFCAAQTPKRGRVLESIILKEFLKPHVFTRHSTYAAPPSEEYDARPAAARREPATPREARLPCGSGRSAPAPANRSR